MYIEVSLQQLVFAREEESTDIYVSSFAPSAGCMTAKISDSLRGKAIVITIAKLNEYRRRLQLERDGMRRLTSISADGRKPVELDQTTQGRLSRIDALQVQEMALEQERRRGIKVQRIESALRRIEAGGFGYCTSCGDDIEPKRLANDPAVPLCLACAQR